MRLEPCRHTQKFVSDKFCLNTCQAWRGAELRGARNSVNRASDNSQLVM